MSHPSLKKVVFLTSGFPQGFTDDFINRLLKYYSKQGSLVFLASDFSGHARTDKHVTIFVSMFQEKGVFFEEVRVIDDRISKQAAVELLERADVVWISGGDTLMQIDYIREYGLILPLRNRNGITIGMSAGSINMAETVVLPKDEKNNIPELSIYEGIGLVDINIEPHLDPEDEKHTEDIHAATKHATIYGLFDNSFIEVVDRELKIYGNYIKYKFCGLKA